MMAEHYRLTRDKDWLRQNAPKMRQMCGWIIAQRHQTLAHAAAEVPVANGLIRYRPYADLLHPAADYFSNGYLWKGLDAAAHVFAEIGLTSDAHFFQREADDYLRDIRKSMDAAVFLDHGIEVLPMIPDSHELWKESDGSANGYYGIIASPLLETGVLDGNDAKANLVRTALRKRGGLIAGVCRFHDMADHAYTYGYWMNCLERDEIEPVILGLYGSLAYGMSRDTFSAVECTKIRTGENYWTLPHTYSNTQQLRLLRNMLVREDGQTLWLGQSIPRDWLQAGKRIGVDDAPTTFGSVTYSITANTNGSMRVELTPPMVIAPRQIVLRLRGPGRQNIAHIESEGGAKVTFSKDMVRLSGLSAPITLKVTFK
jgi:hypothetical protein